jgi:type II secretory pathway pseudopilin PulG
MSRKPNNTARGAGFTLIENVMSMLIIGGMLVMVINTLGSSVRGKRIRQSQSRAPALAGQLMAEILQANYDDPDDETPIFGSEVSEIGTGRSNFDDVDDYHNWSSAPQDKDGVLLTDLDGWTRSVLVRYVLPTDLTATSVTDEGVKCITVTATDPFGNSSSITAVRSSVGSADQAPSVETTFVTWAGVELQIGVETGDRVVAGTNVLNKVSISGN